MRYLALLLVAGVIAAAPLASTSTATGVCRVSRLDDGAPVGTYPEHPLSPFQSLHSFDLVFLGEVVVPTRKCSLGWCAGVRVIKLVKGHAQPTVLMQVSSAAESACGPQTFREKGVRWLVFANSGTTPGGTSFVHAGEDGPSFVAHDLPDFALLEGRYRQRRAQLDEALDARLGRLR